MDNRKMNRWLLIVAAVIVVAVILLFVFGSGLGRTSISYTEFVAKTESGMITKITTSGYAVTAEGYKDDDFEKKTKTTYSTVFLDRQQFAGVLERWGEDAKDPGSPMYGLKISHTDPQAGEMWTTSCGRY